MYIIKCRCRICVSSAGAFSSVTTTKYVCATEWARIGAIVPAAENKPEAK